MKAFLLAAGHGTRLKPLTDTTPKCLIPIRGIPMLQIWIEQCRRYGIREILVNIHAHADLVHAYLRKSAPADLRVQISEEPELLGSAGTLRANRDWIASDQLFWVFYSDVLTDADLGRMLEFHRQKRQLATLGVYSVSDPRRCGIVDVNGASIIQSFVEKPERPAGNLAFSGLMIAHPSVLDAIPDGVPRDIGFHLLPRLAGNMAAHQITGYLLDIGTMENYKVAQDTWPGLDGLSARC